MRRLGSIIRFILWLSFLAVLLTLILGQPLYLELAGVSAHGMVVAKREVIDVTFGTWTRHLFLDVRFLPRDTEESEVTQIAAFRETYDQLRVEQPVRVRYFPNPTLRWLRTMAMTRLESQRPLESLLARLDRTQILLLIGIVVWLTLLMAWSKWRRWWLALAALAMLIGGALALSSSWPAPTPAGPLVSATATVRATHAVTQIGDSRRSRGVEALQPYTIVELSFVPAGMAASVVAVDVIDTGSMSGLEKGAALPIHYSAAEVRWAEIDGAARTYYWKNVLNWGLVALPFVGLLLLIWGFNWWWGIRQRRRTLP